MHIHSEIWKTVDSLRDDFFHVDKQDLYKEISWQFDVNDILFAIDRMLSTNLLAEDSMGLYVPNSDQVRAYRKIEAQRAELDKQERRLLGFK